MWKKLLLLLVVAGALLWYYLPYQSVAAYKLRQALEGYGIHATALKVEKLESRSAVLTGIALESKTAAPLEIGRLQADFTLKKLRHGKLDRLAVEGFSGTLYQQDGVWKLAGMEDFHTDPTATQTPNPLFDAAALRAMLPEAITLTKGKLKVQPYTVPFTLEMALTPAITLAVATEAVSVDLKPYALSLSPTKLAATLNEGKWQGTLKIAALTLNGLSLPLPPLKVTAEYSVGPDQLRAQVKLTSKDKAWRSDLALTAPLANPRKGTLLVKHLEFPWGGGRIAMDAVKLPLAMNKPIAVKLQLHEVQLATLMEGLGEGKVKATGRISGILPVTYHPDGTVTLQQGTAEAMEAGTLSLAPELLPGDNAQLALARGTLENFHYTKLQIGVSLSGENKSVLHLSLEGRNPDAKEQRPVKLNINLTGDILPLIQQSILPFNDLKKLLQTQEK